MYAHTIYTTHAAYKWCTVTSAGCDVQMVQSVHDDEDVGKSVGS